MWDEIPALQHRLMVGEEAVDFQERRDRHDEERVVRLRRHEVRERSSHGLGVGHVLEVPQVVSALFCGAIEYEY